MQLQSPSSLPPQIAHSLYSDREWTSTDAGYLIFFLPMHVLALVLGPLTFSWDAFEVMLGS